MKNVLLFLFTIFVFACCNSGEKPLTPEQLKFRLKIDEITLPPTKYVSIAPGASMKQNLIREAGLFNRAEYDGWMVQGIIKNTATMTRFKDAVLTFQALSKTETVLEEKDYIIYDYYEPNSEKNFTLKIYKPDNAPKFKVFLKKATAVIE